MLFVFPATIHFFQPSHWPREALLGFWLGDMTLLVLGSLLTAVAIWKEWRWSRISIWFLAGGSGYATLYCIAVSLWTGEAWMASALMTCMSGLTLALATIIGYKDGDEPSFFRPLHMGKGNALGWTAIQIVIFWSVFLWILPKGIIEAEGHLGWLSYAFPYQLAVSVTLFAVASAIGMWSGVTMAFAGEATPLPSAMPKRLVMTGPYRWLRNPMAAAGILQGFSVGLAHGSLCTMIYALLGAGVWHFLVRPVEEADLKQRFGVEYEGYRSRVGLWIPSFAHRAQSHDPH